MPCAPRQVCAFAESEPAIDRAIVAVKMTTSLRMLSSVGFRPCAPILGAFVKKRNRRIHSPGLIYRQCMMRDCGGPRDPSRPVRGCLSASTVIPSNVSRQMKSRPPMAAAIPNSQAPNRSQPPITPLRCCSAHEGAHCATSRASPRSRREAAVPTSRLRAHVLQTVPRAARDCGSIAPAS